MAGKGKTKAELQAELDEARALIAAMTEMLGVIHDLADAPLSDGDYVREASVRSHRMSTIKAYTDLETFTLKPHYIAAYLETMRANVKPVTYKVYVPKCREPADDAHSCILPKGHEGSVHDAGDFSWDSEIADAEQAALDYRPVTTMS